MTIKPYNTERNILQCFKCQRVGHTSVNCEMRRRCVKCSQDHGKDHCPVNRSNGKHFLKCALCGGSHTANAAICMVRNSEISKIKMKQAKLNTEWLSKRCSGPEIREKEALSHEVLRPKNCEKEALSHEVLRPKKYGEKEGKFPNLEALRHNSIATPRHTARLAGKNVFASSFYPRNEVLRPEKYGEKEGHVPNDEEGIASGELMRLFGKNVRELVQLSMDCSHMSDLEKKLTVINLLFN